jgi:hypothetical protein
VISEYAEWIKSGQAKSYYKSEEIPAKSNNWHNITLVG